MMDSACADTNNLYFLQGGGEMGAMTRSADWEKTALGHPKHWPQALKTLVATMLDNPFAMYIAWGADYLQLYNDGYRPILGTSKHPQALGISSKETFAEIWAIIGPMFDSVMQGKAIGFPDFMLPLNRNGFTEQCYFDFSYSPIRNDDGSVGGVLVTVIETTQKKQTENNLKLSEDQLKMALEGGDLGTFDYYPLEEKLIWSAKTKELFGLPANALVDIDLYRQALHPEDRANSEEVLIHGAVLIEGFYELEYRTIGISDGKLRWLRSKGKATYDDSGKPVRYTGVVQEITARKVAEQALKASEERFRMMADNIPNLVWMADATGYVYWYNKQWHDYTGVRADQMVGWGWESVHDPAVLPTVIEKWKYSIDSGQPFEMIFPLRRHDGVYCQFITRVLPLRDAHGNIIQWFGTNTDITQQIEAEQRIKESEERFRYMAHNSEILIGMGDETSNATYFNQAWERLTGRPMQVFLEFGWADLIHPDDRESYVAKYLAAFERRIALSEEFRVLSSSGDYRWIMSYVTPRFRPEGSFAGYISSCIDITPLKEVEKDLEEKVTERTQALYQTNVELQKSNAELEQFAYIASHDLQEPLRKIRTFAELLGQRIDRVIDPKSKEYLYKIDSSASRMSNLIKDVLNYSELTEITVDAAVDLNEILNAVFVEFDLFINQKQAIVKHSSLPIIEGVPLQMTQLFSNIISNALKYARKDQQLVIEITATELKQAQKSALQLNAELPYYHIQFKDNGIGFEKQYATQIFDIFQRLHRKSEYEGTGIGLALCKKIVLNHHGAIDAQGSSENGAVFNIYLPSRQP